MAEEVSLLLAPIVVLATEGATTIGRKNDFAPMPFGKRVKVTAEYRLQIVFFETLQERLGVRRSRDDSRAEREMREDNQRPFLIDLGQRFV